jgi:Enoyl-(Acyl carrier protein) reductase
MRSLHWPGILSARRTQNSSHDTPADAEMYVRQENSNRHRSVARYRCGLGRGLPKVGYNVVATSRNDEPAGFPLHDSAHRGADVEAEIWKRCDDLCGARRSAYRRPNASVSMMTKGGLNTVTRSLAIEYAKEGIRFNAVAPGVVDTALHRDGPSSDKARQPLGKNRGRTRSCRGCSLPSSSRSGNRRGAARRWRCPRGLLVALQLGRPR